MSTWVSIVNPGPTSTMPAILGGQPHSHQLKNFIKPQNKKMYTFSWRCQFFRFGVFAFPSLMVMGGTS